MFSLSNALSVLRAPLALLFLVQSPMIRLAALILAMSSDALDGFLARRRRSATQFGAVLDPAMDKLFVFIVLGVLIHEGACTPWQGLAMLARDAALCLFGIYLALSGKWGSYQFRSIRWGKATTALQFIILISFTLQWKIPDYVFGIFVLFGVLALVELFQLIKKRPSTTEI